MIENPHPRIVAADFESWCIQCDCNPGDPGFQPSLAAAIQNAIIGYIRGLEALNGQLVDDLTGSSFDAPAQEGLEAQVRGYLV